MRHFGIEPFQFPRSLQYNMFAPTSEYPCLQLNWCSDPSTKPLPLTKPFGIDEGRRGHSKGKKQLQDQS